MKEIIIICKDKKEVDRIRTTFDKIGVDYQHQGLRIVFQRDNHYREISRHLHRWHRKYNTQIFTLRPLIVSEDK